MNIQTFAEDLQQRPGLNIRPAILLGVIMNIFQQEEFNPPGDRIRFRYDGRYIGSVIIGDIDMRRCRRLLLNFRQTLRRTRRCWTCFQNPRTVINYPCGCSCNCTACSSVMTLCSTCGNRITSTSTIVML